MSLRKKINSILIIKIIMDGMDRSEFWVSIAVGGLCFINLTFASTANRLERLRPNKHSYRDLLLTEDSDENSEEENEQSESNSQENSDESSEEDEYSDTDSLLTEDSDENSEEEDSGESPEGESEHSDRDPPIEYLTNDDCDFEGLGSTSLKKLVKKYKLTVKVLLRISSVGKMLRSKTTKQRIKRMNLAPEDILRIELALCKSRQMEEGSEEKERLAIRIVNSFNAMVRSAEQRP
jgi:hypothetical protein